MITYAHRFHGLGSLRRLYKNCQTLRNPLLAVKYKRTHRQTYRVAVVVSKKIDKSAVVRNRIRRRVYEIVRVNEKLITESFDFAIIIFSNQVATISYEKLHTAITDQLKQAKIMEPRRGIVDKKEE